MNDKAGFELAPSGDGGAADLDRSNRAALRLDRRTAAPGNGAGNAPAQEQVVVGRVNNGVDILIGQVAL